MAVKFEKHRDSDYFKNGQYEYPPDTWVRTTVYKCSNCGHVVFVATEFCPSCTAFMKIRTY